MSTPFELLPALDISESWAVRPAKGQLDSGSTKVHPAEVLEQFIQAGAEWVHIVDLDQAFGRGNNQDLISKLVSLAPQIDFQISGGIQDQNSFSRALDSGAKRINVSSMSLADNAWLRKTIEKYREIVSFALDIQGALVMPRGSSDNFGSFEYVVDYLEDLEVKVICLTDVVTDGMLTGPNQSLIDRVSTLTSARLISSGGVATISQLISLLESTNCSGAIVGKAIQVGDFDLAQALEIVNG